MVLTMESLFNILDKLFLILSPQDFSVHYVPKSLKYDSSACPVRNNFQLIFIDGPWKKNKKPEHGHKTFYRSVKQF